MAAIVYLTLIGYLVLVGAHPFFFNETDYDVPMNNNETYVFTTTEEPQRGLSLGTKIFLYSMLIGSLFLGCILVIMVAIYGRSSKPDELPIRIDEEPISVDTDIQVAVKSSA